MILAATGNRYQLDEVEQAMEIQIFPMTRYVVTTTALVSTIATFWEAPSTRTTVTCQRMKKGKRTMRRILTHWRRRKKKQKPWHLWPHQTEHSGMLLRNNIRYGCHVVIILSNRSNAIVPTGGRNGNASSAAVHTGLQSVQKSKGNQARRREKHQPTQRTANLLWRCAHRSEHARKRSARNRKGSG